MNIKVQLRNVEQANAKLEKLLTFWMNLGTVSLIANGILAFTLFMVLNK